MRRKSIALISALTLLLYGCSFDAPQMPSDTHTPKDTSYPSEFSQPDTTTSSGNQPFADEYDVTVTYEAVTGKYQTDDKTTDLLTLEYQRPTVTVWGHEDTTSSIADILSEHENSFLENVKNHLGEANEMYEELSDAFSPYYFSSSYEQKRCNGRILSLMCQYDDYFGGPHGTYTYTGLNFDLASGRLLTLDDIATDSDVLIKSAEDYILSLLELERYHDIMENNAESLHGTLTSSVLTDDMWYFTNSGITFVSNLYVLGPYAAGAYFFNVPYHTLDGLKEEYLYTGAYELAAPIDTSVTYDIDGDGSMDEIYYNCIYQEDMSDVSVTLTINETDFSSYMQSEESFLSPDSLFNMDAEYYLIDLNSDDAFTEIAILDHGINDYRTTYFFRYNKGTLSLLGSVPECLDNPNITVNGDGTIDTYIPLNLLETAKAPATFQLENDETISLVSEDWFYVDETNFPEEYKSHRILENVTVYTANQKSAETVTLTPDDGPVRFPATDNEHWFILQTPDDHIYYLYLEDFLMLESGQSAADVFENLLLAG